MEEWKLRKLLYDKFAIKHDIILNPEIEDCSKQELIDGIKQQFNDSDVVKYPYKSYVVALVYAYHLKQKYGNTYIHYLDDDLLPNDICFIKYSNAKDIYDYFLNDLWWLNSPMSVKIYRYWYEEYCDEGFMDVF